MSAPKHLWSGDWRADSATAAQQRASQRTEIPRPPEEPPPPERGPSWRAQALAALGAAWQALVAGAAALVASRRVRGAVLVGATLLVIGGVGAGIRTLLHSNNSPAASAGSNIPYLGVQMQSVPVNRVLVAGVVPGSPADRAGIGPGDVITAINHRSVGQPGDVISALSSLHPGSSVFVQFSRGGIPYSTQVTLTGQPARSP